MPESSTFAKSKTGTPCIFLSHKKEDKEFCKKIAEYISDAGFDYYFDEEDEDLQNATLEGDHKAITNHIREGICQSSHMLVIVSKATYRSMWIPFEIGFGHAFYFGLDSEDFGFMNSIELSVLTLEDVSEISLPSYLEVAHIIRGG